MKKLIALLVGCMLITSAFASCGSEGGTNNSGSKAATSDTAETTDEITTEEDTTEAADTTTKARTTTTAKTTKATTTEKATEPSEAEDSEFVGKWELVKVGYEDEIMTENNDGVSFRSAYRLEFNEDGSGICISCIDEETIEFDWTAKSSTKAYLVSDDGDTLNLVIKNGYLTVTDENNSKEVWYLEKVNKYTDYEGSSGGGSNGGGSSSNVSESDFVGTWSLESMTAGGIDVGDYYGASAEGLCYIEVHRDGTGVIRDCIGEEDDDQNFEWELRNSKLVLTDNEGNESSCELKNGKLVLGVAEDDGILMIFKKVR